MKKNSKEHFQRTKIVNFDIKGTEAKGKKVPDYIFKKYQTAKDSRVSKYPKKDRDNFSANAFKREKRDTYFEKKVIIDHFKKKLLLKCL